MNRHPTYAGKAMNSVTEQPVVRALWRFVLLRSAWRRSFAMEPPRALPLDPEGEAPAVPRRVEGGQHCCCRP